MKNLLHNKLIKKIIRRIKNSFLSQYYKMNSSNKSKIRCILKNLQINSKTTKLKKMQKIYSHLNVKKTKNKNNLLIALVQVLLTKDSVIMKQVKVLLIKIKLRIEKKKMIIRILIKTLIMI